MHVGIDKSGGGELEAAAGESTVCELEAGEETATSPQLPAASESSAGESPPPDRIVKNLVWLAGIVWTLHYVASQYTEFPTSVPLIASLLVAVSFATGWLPESFVKSCTQRIQRVLFHDTAGLWLSRILVAELLLGFFVGVGSVEINPAAGTWTVGIADDEDGKPTTSTIPASGQKKKVWFFSPRFNPRRLTVSSRGLPRRTVVLKPWSTVRIDEDFFYRRPALLLVVSPDTARHLGSDSFVLVVDVDGDQTVLANYQGEPVWVGVSEDVEIPDWVRDDWETWVPHESRSKWIRSDRLAVHASLLTGKEIVRARVHYADRDDESKPGDPLTAEICVPVTMPQRMREFPQQEMLDVEDN